MLTEEIIDQQKKKNFKNEGKINIFSDFFSEVEY